MVYIIPYIIYGILDIIVCSHKPHLKEETRFLKHWANQGMTQVHVLL